MTRENKANVHERAPNAKIFITDTVLKCKQYGVMIIKPGRVEHRDELQHLPWQFQSHDFNIIKSLGPVLERGVRSRFPEAIKRCSDVL